MRSSPNTRWVLYYTGVVLTVLGHQRLPQVLALQGQIGQPQDQPGHPQPARAREGQEHSHRARDEGLRAAQLFL